jgi:alpha-1,3-glucosyltransferase
MSTKDASGDSSHGKAYFSAALILTGLKIMLIDSPYRSTDFDVHRNWLAITNKLPVDEWYTESTCKWTLDYPPLFAWFEYTLSQFAPSIILPIQADPLQTQTSIWFQKITVIITDLVYIYACYLLTTQLSTKSTRFSTFLALAGNIGIFMVDHMHFQYNGLLFGFLILSIYHWQKGNVYFSAFWFAVLLNFKHLFLYVAAAYGLVMIFQFVKFSFTRLVLLGLTVVSVFSVSILPFYKVLPELLSRLFPFTRGLTHAYWAPNIWAIYNFVDVVSAKFYGKQSGLMTGVIGGSEQEHVILPEIKPEVCAIITLAVTVMGMLKLVRDDFMVFDRNLLVKGIVFCGWTSFMFGWHVHEKAILTVIVPLTVLDAGRFDDLWFLTTCLGHYSLFPLFFTPVENILKLALFAVYQACFYRNSKNGKRVIHKIILFGQFLLMIYTEIPVIHSSIFGDGKMEFLPIMMISVYTGIGLIYCYLEFVFGILVGNHSKSDSKSENKTKKSK